jgi:hypothetical protein
MGLREASGQAGTRCEIEASLAGGHSASPSHAMKALPELRATYESQFEIINECLEAVAGCDWRFHIDATVPEVLKMSCIHGVDTLDRYTQCSCVVLASKRPDGKWSAMSTGPRHSR